MKIAVGSDDVGFELKTLVSEFLKSQGHEVDDFGPPTPEPVDYPDVAEKLAVAVGEGKYTRGILICGTGIGMAIVANKVPGVRAAQAHDVYSAERARKSNAAQILTMGARVIGPELAKMIVKAWLDSEFTGGGSARKVDKINRIDERFRHRGEVFNRGG